MKKLFSALLISVLFLATSLSVSAETVVYNPNSKIYHNMSCSSAAKCKVCKKIDKKQAIKNGAKACKRCGG